MKQKLPTLTIGIPAWNEEAVIKKTLSSLLSQDTQNFILEKIVVISDGSSDRTDQEVESLTDPRIVLINDGQRQGKTPRLNQLLKIVDSDILVLLDADILIKSNSVIANLIKPLSQKPGIEITSGRTQPIQPETFTQMVVKTGFDLWESAKGYAPKNGMYYCSGAIRALSKNVYKNMEFPRVKADDIYPYLFAVQHSVGFEYVSQAIVYIGLPKSLSDYVKQMNRYLESPQEHIQVFGSEFVQDNFTINLQVKLKTLFLEWYKNPFWISMYLTYLLIPKTLLLIHGVKKQLAWEYIGSSKSI